MNKWLSEVPGCFFHHPGICLRERPRCVGCCAVPERTSYLEIVREINYTHRSARGSVSPAKVKLQKWPRVFSSSAQCCSHKGIFGQKGQGGGSC